MLNGPDSNEYYPPEMLVKALERIEQNSSDPRVLKMLQGYFLDMYLCLKQIRRICRRDAKIGIVLGNAQYSGEPVKVDEVTAEIGEQAGLKCQKIIVARYRGEQLPIDFVFGTPIKREIRGFPVYTISFNLSS